jgi:hypothetical protein
MRTAESLAYPALTESDEHRGAPVFDPAGNLIGTIVRVYVEQPSERVAYADLTCGGFLGWGSRRYSIPWDKLRQTVMLRGFIADYTEVDQIGCSDRPSVSRQRLLHGRW